ncbi:MAG TPA: biotin/lipoyl-binding protein, partial [Isosphaeraceae bacterium]
SPTPHQAMISKYVLPLLAAAGVGFAIYTVVQARQVPPPTRPIVPPPVRPEFPAIAGAGLVESRRENIPIGAPTPGVVWEVFVRVGDAVKAGDPLFRLDDRAVQAERKVRLAALDAAEAQLRRLQKAPRPEDVPPVEEAVKEAEARLAAAEVTLARTEQLFRRNVAPASDYDRDRYLAAEARAALAKLKAELDRLRQGTWEEDLAVARAAVAQARSQLEATEVELTRLTVPAQTDGEILQVNVRPGQFAALAGVRRHESEGALVVLGDVQRLHVRVDIDEQDLPLFTPGARAVATLKGRPEVRFPLEFVRVEPYVIPKKSLTGDNAERVDTRVLQVIYSLPSAKDRPAPVYVGQQMDVFLEKARTPTRPAPDAGPETSVTRVDEPAPATGP